MRRKSATLFLFACALTTVFASRYAQAQNVSDSTAPQISSVSFSSTSVDTTSGSQYVTASVSATDDLSGVNYMYLYLRTNATTQTYNTRSLTCYIYSLQSGTRTNGVFTGTCSFPQYSQSGTWYVYQAYTYDAVGNNQSYYNGGAQLSFAPQTITVSSPTAPPPSSSSVPALVSVSLNPGSVDTSNSTATVFVTPEITSTGNFNYGYVYLYDPTGRQSVYAYFYNSSRISGDVYDGMYRATFTLPRYSRAGNWVWYYVVLYNTSGAYAEYYNASGGFFTTLYTYNGVTSTSTNLGTSGPTLTPQNLVVTSNPSDTTPPTLVDFGLTPTSIDVATGSAQVHVSVSATDDLSGFNYGVVYFISPNGQQTRGTGFYASSGSMGTIYFPQYSQAGNWRLYYMYLYDNLGNYRYITSTDLANMGFPNSIQISSGLRVSDVSGTYGGNVTLSAVLTYLGAPSVGKSISFSIQGNNVGTAITDGTGTATLPDISLGSIAAGTYVNAIVASFAGDGTQAAASGSATLTVTNKLSQTITFGAIPDHSLSDSPITVNATASSGLTVSFAAVGNCTVSGNTVTLTAAGSCKIVASQVGNATYNPAPAVSQTFNITGKADQTITFTGAPASAAYNSHFNVSASASSGLAVTLGASGACTISGNTVTMTSGTGTCALTADQPGNANYNAATQAVQSTTAVKAGQAITFAAPASPATYNTSFAVSASADSGLTVTIGASGVCSISAGNVTMTGGTGTCTLTASQAGDSNYNAATDVVRMVTAQKAAQTITFAAPASPTTYNTSFGVAPTASSGLTVSVAASGVCSIASNTVTMTSGTGSCTLTASQAGDSNYSAATDVVNSVAAAKAGQTITFTGAPASAVYNTTFNVSSSASSGLTVALGASGACSISGNTVTMTSGTGICALTADQAGDSNYSAATQATQSTTAQKAGQAITFAAPASPATYNTSFAVSASADSGLTVTIGASGVCSISAGNVTMTGGTGTCTLTASQAGDSNYNAATDVVRTVAAQKADQAAVTVTAPTNVTFGGTGTAAATGGSGTGGYSFSAGSSTGCSVAGTTVSVSNASGTCALTATRAGDDNYNDSAPSASFTVALHKADATINVTPYNVTYDGNPHTATGTATGVGNFDLSGQLTLSGTTHTNAGTYNGDAWSFAGGTNYNDASGTVNDAIAKAPSTTNFNPALAPAQLAYNGTYNVSAHTTGDGVLTIGASGACSYAGGVVTITAGSGTCTITASTADGSNYFGSSATPQTITAIKATATVTLGNLTQTFTGGALTPTATTNPAGLTVVWSNAPQTNVGSYAVTATVNDPNYQGSANGTFNIQYGFAGLFSPYAPPTAGVAFKVKSAIPLKWQYTNASGAVVASPNAAPVVQIFAMGACGGTDTTAILVNDSGSSGYQYDPTTNTWQFNWKTTGLQTGCYDIYIQSGQSGQTTGGFPIQLK